MVYKKKQVFCFTGFIKKLKLSVLQIVELSQTDPFTHLKDQTPVYEI